MEPEEARRLKAVYDQHLAVVRRDAQLSPTQRQALIAALWAHLEQRLGELERAQRRRQPSCIAQAVGRRWRGCPDPASPFALPGRPTELDRPGR